MVEALVDSEFQKCDLNETVVVVKSLHWTFSWQMFISIAIDTWVKLADSKYSKPFHNVAPAQTVI